MKSLEAFIMPAVTHWRFAFEISDVKSDGTVFVRFRSTANQSSISLAEAFRDALSGLGMLFEQTDDNKFRLALDQFSFSETV